MFSIIMVVSFLQILQESVQKLLPNGDHKVASLPPVAIGAMAGNAIVKGIIGIGCWPIKTTQVQALVQGKSNTSLFVDRENQESQVTSCTILVLCLQRLYFFSSMICLHVEI